MFGDFMGLTMDSLVNQSAKFWYISAEQGSVPLVVRSAVGAGGRFGAIHSQTHGTWFQGVPGLKIVFPSSPAEAKGLLKAAIRDDNPVVFLEHKRLYSVKGPPPENRDPPARGGRRSHARGDDLTIVSIGKGVPDTLAAADRARRRWDLGGGGRPPDAAPARRGDRARVRRADQPAVGGGGGSRTGGWAAGLLGMVAERGLHDLDDAWIIATDETPIPYSPTLEDAYLPDTDAILASVRSRAGVGVA